MTHGIGNLHGQRRHCAEPRWLGLRGRAHHQKSHTRHSHREKQPGEWQQSSGRTRGRRWQPPPASEQRPPPTGGPAGGGTSPPIPASHGVSGAVGCKRAERTAGRSEPWSPGTANGTLQLTDPCIACMMRGTMPSKQLAPPPSAAAARCCRQRGQWGWTLDPAQPSYSSSSSASESEHQKSSKAPPASPCSRRSALRPLALRRRLAARVRPALHMLPLPRSQACQRLR